MKKNSASKEMMMEHRDRIYIYIAYIWDSTMEMSRITCKNYCTYLQLITYVQLATAAAVPWPLFKTCMRQLVRTTSTPISIQQLVIWSLLWWLIEREASAVGIHAIMMYLIYFWSCWELILGGVHIMSSIYSCIHTQYLFIIQYNMFLIYGFSSDAFGAAACIFSSEMSWIQVLSCDGMGEALFAMTTPQKKEQKLINDYSNICWYIHTYIHMILILWYIHAYFYVSMYIQFKEFTLLTANSSLDISYMDKLGALLNNNNNNNS